MDKKQALRIFYTDFWPEHNGKYDPLYQILTEKYDVILDAKNPDYVIYNCFGNEHLKFDKAIKIYISGENLSADFNCADYAITSDYLEFGDRHFRLPLWRFCLLPVLENQPRAHYKKLAQTKKKFCNFIYSNGSHAAPQRITFFNLLSEHYKQVDSGGRYRNNIGGAVADKIAWQRDYKFSIAFENASQPGYATEKIIDALKADTIPIYWGDPSLSQYLNPKRFINVHDFDNFNAVIEEIKRLDENEEAYIDMLAQPWFVGEPPHHPRRDEAFRKWLLHIFEQDKEQARRITPFGFRQIYIGWQCEAAKKIQWTTSWQNKYIRPIIRKIERPFNKLRDLFYKFCRK